MWYPFFLTGMAAALILSVYFSITARQRGMHPLASRMTLGKMNVSLGFVLTLLGINQFTFEDLTTVRIVVALILLFVGLTNVLFGTRNYLRFRREWLATRNQNG